MVESALRMLWFLLGLRVFDHNFKTLILRKLNIRRTFIGMKDNVGWYWYYSRRHSMSSCLLPTVYALPPFR